KRCIAFMEGIPGRINSLSVSSPRFARNLGIKRQPLEFIEKLCAPPARKNTAKPAGIRPPRVRKFRLKSAVRPQCRDPQVDIKQSVIILHVTNPFFERGHSR